MNIRPEDIDTIESAGMLDGEEIKLVRSRGGFWMACGRKGVLAAGSHPAIVKHTLGKMHPNFQPVLCKSESLGTESVVDRHSHFLSDELRKSGHDIYSIQTGTEIEFQITKHNIKVASVPSHIMNDTLVIDQLKFPKEFSRAMAGAATEKALACKSKSIMVK